MRGLCCLGVVHAAVCWGRLRSAGGTNAAPPTCAMVFLRGGCEARHQRRRAGGGGPGGGEAPNLAVRSLFTKRKAEAPAQGAAQKRLAPTEASAARGP